MFAQILVIRIDAITENRLFSWVGSPFDRWGLESVVAHQVIFFQNYFCIDLECSQVCRDTLGMYIRTIKVPSSNGSINEYVRIMKAYRQDGKPIEVGRGWSVNEKRAASFSFPTAGPTAGRPNRPTARNRRFESRPDSSR